jgi:hypothetical protein
MTLWASFFPVTSNQHLATRKQKLEIFLIPNYIFQIGYNKQLGIRNQKSGILLQSGRNYTEYRKEDTEYHREDIRPRSPLRQLADRDDALGKIFSSN